MKKIAATIITNIFCITTFSANIYVAEGGTGNGATWATAFGSLQDALLISANGDVIRVAAGTYYPFNGNKRDTSFVLKNGVKVLGGYPKPGTYPPLPPEQEPPRDSSGKKNLTILSGEVQKDGIDTNNSFHVVIAHLLDSTTLLDGFTITNGHARGSNEYYKSYGGGAMVVAGNPTFKNLIFRNNNAFSGGGLAILSGHGFYENINVADNTASIGAGIIVEDDNNHPITGDFKFNEIYAANNHSSFMGGGFASRSSNIEIYNSSFVDNYGNAYGGGLAIDGGKLTLINSTVTGNSCDTISVNSSGGGIYEHSYGSVYQNVLLANNSANRGGGVVFVNQYSKYSGITFCGNIASQEGNAFYCQTCSNSKLQNSIIDSIGNGKKAYFINPGSWSFSFFNCLFQGQTNGGLDSGGNIVNQDPMYNNPSLGDYNLKTGSPAINSGYNAFSLPGIMRDLNNKVRIAGGTVDMGAYEYGSWFPAEVIQMKSNKLPIIYPNPANEYVTIETQANSVISLINVAGQSVKVVTCRDEKTLLNTMSLNSGIYYLHIRTATGIISNQKLIINH
jgi:hypothetical protein